MAHTPDPETDTAQPTLRIATLAAAPAIAALTRVAYAKWIPLIGREPLPMVVDYEQAVQRHRFDLLETGGGLIGLIETTANGPDLLIVNVAVAPDVHGQGHGRRLLRHAEDFARDAGLSAVTLYTNQRFASNIELYRSVGYAVEREETLNGGVAVHMRKPLPAIP